ncbi:MAG: transcription termination/antitermination protein NusG [Planctomycetota bacterium]
MSQTQVDLISLPDNSELEAPAADAGDWYALYTRSRHEKRVAGELVRQRVDHLLPLYDVLSQWKDRKKWVQKPLFPGYLFVHVLGEEDLTATWYTRGVVHVVSNGDGPIPVPHDQIEAVRRMIESPVDLDPWPYLKRGQRVRVRSGPLHGIEGYVSRRKDVHRIVVTVDLLGRAVAAEINPESLEAL